MTMSMQSEQFEAIFRELGSWGGKPSCDNYNYRMRSAAELFFPVWERTGSFAAFDAVCRKQVLDDEQKRIVKGCMERHGMKEHQGGLMATTDGNPLASAMGDDLKEAYREAAEKRRDRIASDPNNGRAGWWRVTGIRHSAIARASSASEALDKAMNAGLIGDWEDPYVDFWTEKLHDVF